MFYAMIRVRLSEEDMVAAAKTATGVVQVINEGAFTDCAELVELVVDEDQPLL